MFEVTLLPNLRMTLASLIQWRGLGRILKTTEVQLPLQIVSASLYINGAKAHSCYCGLGQFGWSVCYSIAIT